jgi:hypothetical protein
MYLFIRSVPGNFLVYNSLAKIKELSNSNQRFLPFQGGIATAEDVIEAFDVKTAGSSG